MELIASSTGGRLWSLVNHPRARMVSLHTESDPSCSGKCSNRWQLSARLNMLAIVPAGPFVCLSLNVTGGTAGRSGSTCAQRNI